MSTENLISDNELDKASGGELRYMEELFGTPECPGPKNFDYDSSTCNRCYSSWVDNSGNHYCANA
ncbi:hypothetical protein I6U48_25015 [Clostridium sp. PL3]|uniref:Uncharacterized protein n=1 Tax=Clostridium thailandense TaxID=2794346 RepID=A0A949TPH1_9CLOT|nr:hypothetical protein [Clostridium thailandense]MBV7276150.1 hypothetical protein [Clostridium thailandense]